jgi:hypothetical protein
MDWQFEMSLPSTGDEVLVEYEYIEADPSVGQTDGFDYSLSTEEGEIMYALTEEDYDEITSRIQAHFDLQRQADADEAAIAKWESNND